MTNVSLHTTPRQGGTVSPLSPAAAAAGGSAALELSCSQQEAAFDLQSSLLHLTPDPQKTSCFCYFQAFRERIKAAVHCGPWGENENNEVNSGLRYPRCIRIRFYKLSYVLFSAQRVAATPTVWHGLLETASSEPTCAWTRRKGWREVIVPAETAPRPHRLTGLPPHSRCSISVCPIFSEKVRFKGESSMAVGQSPFFSIRGGKKQKHKTSFKLPLCDYLSLPRAEKWPENQIIWQMMSWIINKLET